MTELRTIQKGNVRQGKGFKGRLYIKCPFCRNEYSFYSNDRISRCSCPRCDSNITLKNLKVADVVCKGGHYSVFLTNIKSSLTEIPCAVCKCPTTLELNPKTGKYRSLDSHRRNNK